MELSLDIKELLRHTEFLVNDPEGCSINSIEGLCEVNEYFLEVLAMLTMLFLYLLCNKNHVQSAS